MYLIQLLFFSIDIHTTKWFVRRENEETLLIENQTEEEGIPNRKKKLNRTHSMIVMILFGLEMIAAKLS